MEPNNAYFYLQNQPCTARNIESSEKINLNENNNFYSHSLANIQGEDSSQKSNILSKKVAKARNFFKGISISKIKADVMQSVAENESMLEKSMNNVCFTARNCNSKILHNYHPMNLIKNNDSSSFITKDKNFAQSSSTHIAANDNYQLNEVHSYLQPT